MFLGRVMVCLHSKAAQTRLSSDHGRAGAVGVPGVSSSLSVCSESLLVSRSHHLTCPAPALDNSIQ